MAEDEWDAVIRVHLKGHAAATHHAVAYWRRRAKAGFEVKASVVHTASVAAFAGHFGQANYTAAKLGIIGLSRVTAMEGERYGIRSNAISPSARTRLGLQGRGAEQTLRKPDDPAAFDRFDPSNVSPLVAWLATERCPATAQIFHIDGNRVLVMQMPSVVHQLFTQGQWTIEELERTLQHHLVSSPHVEDFLESHDFFASDR
jgi:NAD(P)-dependent dehydrogenase (short-subunit alcohol dehydrogenase family)